MTPVWKVAVAGFVGTAIEWYDFFLYGTAAALVFNRLFFPDFDPALGSLASLATFAAGFLARPLGAAIFGHLGDTRGRKSMLSLTLLIMGVATFLIGALLTYAQIGVLAPVVLLSLRILQGIGLGGEWGGAVLMAYEHAPAARRGFYGSWPQMGAPAGLLLANFVFLGASSLPENAFLAWGWRIPFLLSLVLVVLGVIVRSTIQESPAFAQLKQARGEARRPLLEVLSKHPRAVLVGAGARAAEAGFIVIFSVFVLGYAIQVDGFARPAVLSALLLGTLCTLVAVPVFGARSDRIGRRPVYVAGAMIATLAAIPACLLIDSRQVGLMTFGVVIGMLGPGIIFGPQASFLAEMFPARVRSSGTSIGFQIGGVLAGGLSPVIAAGLVGTTGNLLPVAGYMVALGLVSLASVALAQVPARRATTGAMSLIEAPGITG